MEAFRWVPYPLEDVPRLMWHPARMTAQLVRQMQDAAVRVGRQLREVAALILRTLDGATRQTTRMRTYSQTELVFGPLTLSFASGVVFARADAVL